MPTPRGADRLFVLGVALLGLLFAARAWLLLSSPVPVDYGEGTTWTYARLLHTRGAYFLPIADEPWIHGTYPPLYPRLHAALGGTLAAGRRIALGGTLLAAGSLAAILVVLGVKGPRALLWAVVFLGAPAVHEWGAMLRVDTLALGLSLLAVAVAMAVRGPAGDVLAALLCANAFFAKQVALSAPVSIAIARHLAGERRRAAAFAALYFTLVVGVFAWLSWRSNGEMWRHLVTYAGFVGLAVGPLLLWGLRFLFTFPVLLPLGLGGLRAYAATPAGVYVLVALGSLLLAGKPGGSANYLLEPSAAVCLAGAVAAERRRAELASQPERRRDFTLLLVVQLVVLCGPGRLLEVKDLLRERRVEARAVAALASAPGPVLSEDLGLTLAAGKEPAFEPFQFGLLARAGRFDPQPVIDRVKDGEYVVVLAGYRLRDVPGLPEALRAHYRFVEQIGPYEVWKPRS